MNKWKRYLWMAMTMALVTVVSCNSEDDAPPSSKPWTEDFVFGNFTVNSVGVTTNQDGVSATYQADYVNASDLPGADFGVLTINIYIPTEEEYSTILYNISAVISLESGESTANLFDSEASSFVNQTYLGDQLYSVYQLAAVYPAGGTVINASNFANIVFQMQADYEEGENVKGTRSIGVEVYKRD